MTKWRARYHNLSKASSRDKCNRDASMVYKASIDWAQVHVALTLERSTESARRVLTRGRWRHFQGRVEDGVAFAGRGRRTCRRPAWARTLLALQTGHRGRRSFA